MMFCGECNKANDFTVAFGITIIQLDGMAMLGFILALYLIPVSFSLQLLFRAVDVLKDC